MKSAAELQDVRNSLDSVMSYDEALEILEGAGLYVDPTTGEVSFFDSGGFAIGLGVTVAAPFVIWLGWTIKDWGMGDKRVEIGGIITAIVGAGMLGGGIWQMAEAF